MFDWYDKVDEGEIQAMAGYTGGSIDILSDDISVLVCKAKTAGIPLGAVQYIIGKMWRTKVAV